MAELEDIAIIRKAKEPKKGFEIVFKDGNIINLRKRRTIPGLLLLLKYAVSSEADLVGSNGRLAEIKSILKGKYEEEWIKDRYGDANKPFSELWTEEGFPFIRAEGIQGNRQYVLDVDDHPLLFLNTGKVERKQLTSTEKETVLSRQDGHCNICGATLKEAKGITNKIFARDRVRVEYDHKIPIEKGGNNDLSNFQALCHYCNKCKRQMCFICTLPNCDTECALVSPEKYDVVKATGEDISDRIVRRGKTP